MLTYRQIEDVGEAFAQILEEAERTIINDMARRIAKLGEVSDTTDWQMQRLEAVGMVRENVTKELAHTLNMSEQRIFEMFDEAATRTLNADYRIAKVAGFEPIPLAENGYLQQIIWAGQKQTEGEFKNLTRTTAYNAEHQFIKALDLSHQLMSMGGYSYQQAIREGIKSLTNSGLQSIVYPGGRKDSLYVAYRRALLTGINQTCGHIQLANMEQMGADLVETTAHPGARPDHAAWQGKVFSVKGNNPKYPSFYENTGYGKALGLCGINCRHSFFPFFEELSDNAYSAEKLREYNEKEVTYNGEKMSLYDATQHQRYIERQIRKWKREAEALDSAGLPSGFPQAKIREWQRIQREFIKQTGLPRDYFREGGRIVLQNPLKRGTIGAGDSRLSYVEKQLGIKRGSPMDVQGALNGANPNYAPGSQYANNCQRCVVAYELRRQGYNVQAQPMPTSGNKVVSNYTKFTAFVDNAGNIMKYKHSPAVDLVHNLSKYPDGTRFAVRHSWKNRPTGHVYIAEKNNGVVTFYNPQNPNIDASTYITNPRARKFGYMPINDAKLNPDIPLTDIVR